MIDPTSELNVYYKVYILLKIYPGDDPELNLPYEKTIRDALSRMVEDEELPWVLKRDENMAAKELPLIFSEEVEEPEEPPEAVPDRQQFSLVTRIKDELIPEFAHDVLFVESELGTTPSSVFEGIEAYPILIKIVPPAWEPYTFVGILSQHQLDQLIEVEYRFSLTWWPTTSVSDDNPFQVVRWDGNYREGSIQSLSARLIPASVHVATNIFESADAFLLFIQKRYAATHEADCQCKGCQETKMKSV
jgi:hypothetical protein